MLRIGLFLLTNLAIIIVASISLRLLGFESILANNGMDLNLPPCWSSVLCLGLWVHLYPCCYPSLWPRQPVVRKL